MIFDSIQEDSVGKVLGLCGPDGTIQLDPSDVCHRSELRTKAPSLMVKYGIALNDLSDGLKASLAGSPSTPPPPTP
jgi:hypothetical protein